MPEITPHFPASGGGVAARQRHYAAASVVQELRPDDGPNTLAAAGSDGGIAELFGQLSVAMQGPTESVGKGKAPTPQDVAVLPEKKAGTDPASHGAKVAKALEDLQNLKDITSIADLFIAMAKISKRTKRGHPEPYSITVPKEAAQEFADMADCAYNVMMGPPLSGMYSFSGLFATQFSRSMSKTELHLGFLAELFKGFSLTDVAKKQLDGILENFVKSLGDIKVETESTNHTVDQTIRIHQTVATEITGSTDPKHQIWIYQPRTRLIYMHVDASTWRWATNKASHEGNTFNVNYAVVDCDLNVNKWITAKPALEAIFKKIMGATFKQYSELRFPDPVDPSATKEKK
ncbi:hypothetical protein RB595_010189 [Gaeumannomyces hyphopodioides]